MTSFYYLETLGAEPTHNVILKMLFVQPYSSSAPEPVSVFSYLAVPKIAGDSDSLFSTDLCKRLECLCEAGIYINGRIILYIGSHEAEIKLCRCFVCKLV